MANDLITINVQPIELAVLVDTRDLSNKAASREIAVMAREELKVAKQENEQTLGWLPTFLTIVDGVLGASEDNVRPDGEIDYLFDVTATGELFEWILDQLMAHSPVKTGRYEHSHLFLADGALADPASPPKASEYEFISSLPYARKIERGESNQASEGVYQVVAALAAYRFGDSARIEFAFRSAPVGDIVEWADKTTGKGFQTAQSRARVKRPHAVEWLTSQPAIVITPTQR